MAVNSLMSVLLVLPGLALYLVGLVFALSTWRRYPRVSAVAAAACALAFMVNLAQFCYQLLIPNFGFDITVYQFVTNATSFFRLVALALLLVAVFIDRGEPKRKPPMPDEDARLPVPPRDDPRIRPS